MLRRGVQLRRATGLASESMRNSQWPDSDAKGLLTEGERSDLRAEMFDAAMSGPTPAQLIRHA